MRIATAALALAVAMPGGAAAQSGDAPSGPVQGNGAARVFALPGAVSAAAHTAPTPEAAQIVNAPILVVDQDVLWASSAWGRRADAEIEARRNAIAAENTNLAADLEAEDAALTELRKTLPPAEFRSRADAFDRRVTQVRTDRDAAARKLVEDANAERDAFLRAALPVISAAMEARGSQVLLDRLTVFLSSDAVNVTAELVAAVDARIGAGPAGQMDEPAQP